MTALGVVLVFVAAALPGLGWAQNSSLFGLNDRDDLFGWEAVGRIDAREQGFCTGTLIAPDLVLTAAHCVFDATTGKRISAQDLVFRAGLRNGQPVAERGVQQIATSSAYQPTEEMTLQNLEHDVALLQLAQPIVSAEADPFVLFSGNPDGRQVSVVSYGQDRSEVLSWQRVCSILVRQPPMMVFDCDVTFGSSGAPVFVREGTRGRILSIISGGAEWDGKAVALGMTLPAIVDDLKRTLRLERQRPTASIRRLTVGGPRDKTGAKFVRP